MVVGEDVSEYERWVDPNAALSEDTIPNDGEEEDDVIELVRVRLLDAVEEEEEEKDAVWAWPPAPMFLAISEAEREIRYGAELVLPGVGRLPQTEFWCGIEGSVGNCGGGGLE
ncbi:hypothetical protein BG006_002030, partial [Podila minutissima]